MTSFAALGDGIRRVNGAPAMLAGVFAATLLAALPFSLVMRDALAAHLDGSLAAGQALAGVHAAWWAEFRAQAGPLGQTFDTTIIGFAAVLDNLSALLDGESRPSPLLWLGGGYLLLWLFLSGGILNRYARARPVRPHEFFAACGVFFGRFLRLAPAIALAYYAAFAYARPFLLDTVHGALTRDVTAERVAFAWRLALYLAFGALLVIVSIVFDYARVRAVVEDRRSMIGAIAAGLRFVRRNAAGVAGLYALNGLLFGAVLALYAAADPGAAGSIWFAVAAGQVYLVARLWVRLVFFASETALFQGRLAHAGYVARPAFPRPEPPIVEPLLAPRAADPDSRP